MNNLAGMYILLYKSDQSVLHGRIRSRSKMDRIRIIVIKQKQRIAGRPYPNPCRSNHSTVNLFLYPWPFK
jgi:hypothetical protein